MPPSELARAASLIRSAPALLICAGAGMGVDSGLPDFRGPEGFWRAYPPYRRLGLQFTELADPAHFDDDPEFAWGFYGHRSLLYRETVPHRGFSILRSWALRLPARIFTSNVDGQFQRAGFTDVAEVHGAIGQLQCSVPCDQQIWAAGSPPAVDETAMRARRPLPLCARCGAIARPNILMFGDGAWVPDRTSAQLESLSGWLASHGDGLVVVELGAGLAVPTVRHQAERCSRDGVLIRINLREPQVPRAVDVGLALGARAALEELDAYL